MQRPRVPHCPRFLPPWHSAARDQPPPQPPKGGAIFHDKNIFFPTMSDQSYCDYHNLIHCNWIMCPRCFDTLLSILRSHCTTEQVNQILHILLGSGTCPPPEQDDDLQCEHSNSQDQSLTTDEESLDPWEMPAELTLPTWPTHTNKSPSHEHSTTCVEKHPPGLKLLENTESLQNCAHSYETDAHNLKMLTLERQQHIEEQQNAFVNNLVDWSEYILENIID